MRIVSIAVVVLLWVGLVLGLYWYYLYEPVPERPAVKPFAELTSPDTGSTAAKYPVPDPDREHVATDSTAAAIADSEGDRREEADPEPLPPLNESDQYLWGVLAELVGQAVIDQWLKDERIVERLVVTISSLDGKSIPLRFWPVHHLEGLPAITSSGNTRRWSAVNTVRYRPLVDILTSIEPRMAARAYFRSYPLFQQAWEGLGVEPVHFNDRLVVIVEHLLRAPDIETGFEVKQPKVLYEFAAPELEAQSWGRKVLMRMGPDNAERVKDWLRRLRKELVKGERAPDAAD